jgi:hypothetical protein
MEQRHYRPAFLLTKRKSGAKLAHVMQIFLGAFAMGANRCVTLAIIFANVMRKP